MTALSYSPQTEENDKFGFRVQLVLFVGTGLMAFLLWPSQGQAGPPASSAWSTERILAGVCDHVRDAISPQNISWCHWAEEQTL